MCNARTKSLIDAGCNDEIAGLNHLPEFCGRRGLRLHVAIARIVAVGMNHCGDLEASVRIESWSQGG
jgi:hypothetical protein